MIKESQQLAILKQTLKGNDPQSCRSLEVMLERSRPLTGLKYRVRLNKILDGLDDPFDNHEQSE